MGPQPPTALLVLCPVQNPRARLRRRAATDSCYGVRRGNLLSSFRPSWGAMSIKTGQLLTRPSSQALYEPRCPSRLVSLRGERLPAWCDAAVVVGPRRGQRQAAWIREKTSSEPGRRSGFGCMQSPMSWEMACRTQRACVCHSCPWTRLRPAHVAVRNAPPSEGCQHQQTAAGAV